MKTRKEHLAWCKDRAMSEFDYYVEKEGFAIAKNNATASMLSDLGKHAETRSSQTIVMLVFLTPMHSRADVKKAIDGFN